MIYIRVKIENLIVIVKCLKVESYSLNYYFINQFFFSRFVYVK
mgnify:CR=1 FL=1